jgi:hypothetical protein
VLSLFKQSDFQERGEKMEERLSALFELRVGEMRGEMREEMREESERIKKELNDKIEKQREESEKQMESLRSNMARVESDNTQLKIDNTNLTSEVTQLKLDNSTLLSTVSRIDSENARLNTDLSLIQSSLSEIRGDLETLHPLPYARLKLSHCIKIQEDCNAALNAFHTRYSPASINSDPSLSHQLRELNKELKKAWDARFAAAHLCLPPPTLANVLHAMAERGYTKEVMRCMNLNKATRSCEMLQKVMREVKGRFEMTQLHYFARSGMISSVNRMLSMKGIEVESRNIYGDTPLILASFGGHIEIVDILLNHGAKIESKSNVDATPLYCACGNGQLTVVNLLINKGANTEASYNDGWRPLHAAAWNGHLEIVKALIAKGAGTNARTNDGESALSKARRFNRPEVVAFLRNIGAIDDGIADDEEEEEEDDDDDDDNVENGDEDE